MFLKLEYIITNEPYRISINVIRKLDIIKEICDDARKQDKEAGITSDTTINIFDYFLQKVNEMVNGLIGNKNSKKSSADSHEINLMKTDKRMFKKSNSMRKESVEKKGRSSVSKNVLETIKLHLETIDNIFLKLSDNGDSSKMLQEYYHNLVLMYWHISKIYEDKDMIEEAIDTLNEISKLIEDKFGKNNKAYLDTNTQKSRLVLLLSRRSANPKLREKRLSSSQYVVLKNAGYSTLNEGLKKNQRKLMASAKKRSLQNLNKSSGSQKEIKKINKKASLLIERSVKLPGNLIPIRSSDVKLKAAYAAPKQKITRRSVRPKRKNWLETSNKIKYMPFPGYAYTSKKRKKGKTNRYKKHSMFNPISPFTQKPTNHVIFNDQNQFRNTYNNYLMQNNLSEAQKQLTDYSAILSDEMTMRLLNRPLNDDEIKQIIKNRVAQTIDAVEEAKRDYILTHSPHNENINDKESQSYDTSKHST